MPEQKGAAEPVKDLALTRECLPLGGTQPNGARIKVVIPGDPSKGIADVTQDYWDFDCDGLVSAAGTGGAGSPLGALEKVKQGYLDNGDVNTPSGSVGGIDFNPFFETTFQIQTIWVHGPNGDTAFRSGQPGPTVDDLIKELRDAYSACCL